LHPAFVIYEPGFTRAGAALARAAGVKMPIYRFMFSETLAFGFPPRPTRSPPISRSSRRPAGSAPWMVAGLSVDIRPLIGEAVARGGHVRVGLEDAQLGTTMSNFTWVEEAVRIVRNHGAEPASGAEMRQALGAQ